jgi:hypothetical protein
MYQANSPAATAAFDHSQWQPEIDGHQEQHVAPTVASTTPMSQLIESGQVQPTPMYLHHDAGPPTALDHESVVSPTDQLLYPIHGSHRYAPTPMQPLHWHLTPQPHHTATPAFPTASSSSLAPMIPFITQAPSIQPHATLAPPLPAYGLVEPSSNANDTRHVTRRTTRPGQSALSAPAMFPLSLVDEENEEASLDAGASHAMSVRSRRVKRSASIPIVSVSVTFHPDIIEIAKDFYLMHCILEGEFFPSTERKAVLAQEFLLQSRSRYQHDAGVTLNFQVTDINMKTISSVC